MPFYDRFNSYCETFARVKAKREGVRLCNFFYGSYSRNRLCREKRIKDLDNVETVYSNEQLPRNYSDNVLHATINVTARAIYLFREIFFIIFL